MNGCVKPQGRYQSFRRSLRSCKEKFIRLPKELREQTYSFIRDSAKTSAADRMRIDCKFVCNIKTVKNFTILRNVVVKNPGVIMSDLCIYNRIE